MDDAQLRAYLAAAPDAILLVDDGGIIREANPAVEVLVGRTTEDLVGHHVSTLAAARFHDRLAAVLAGDHRSARRLDARDLAALHADGRETPVDISLTPVPAPDGRRWLVAAVRDVSERVRLREEAEASAARLRAFLDSAPDAMVVVDGDGVVQYANPQLTEMLGYTYAEVIGHSVDRLVPDRARAHHAALRAGYAEHPVARPMGSRDLTARRKDSRELPVDISLGPIPQADGTTWTLAAIRDVTETRAVEQALERAQAQYRFLAEHDALTGLANRRQLERDLAAHVELCRRHGPRGALLSLDVDHFKSVNDRLGHPVGDRLVVEVGRRLRSATRETDLVARQGGDEFLVLIRDGDLGDARDVGGRLVAAVHDAGRFLHEDGLVVTGSVGVVAFEQLAEAELSVDLAMIRADVALYAAKERGRNGLAVFGD